MLCHFISCAYARLSSTTCNWGSNSWKEITPFTPTHFQVGYANRSRIWLVMVIVKDRFCFDFLSCTPAVTCHYGFRNKDRLYNKTRERARQWAWILQTQKMELTHLHGFSVQSRYGRPLKPNSRGMNVWHVIAWWPKNTVKHIASRSITVHRYGTRSEWIAI